MFIVSQLGVGESVKANMNLLTWHLIKRIRGKMLKRIIEYIGIDTENMVLSNQVHDNKIRIVSGDRGKVYIEKAI